jgi:methylmalonyl-CoA/ethylmalonyl-CoA epimerase
MKLHHVGIVVEDIKAGIERYKKMFGFVPVTKVVDDPVQKVSVVLLSGPEADSVPVELISPLSDDSTVSKILQRNIHLYHLCFLVEDIEESIKNLRSNGSIIISGPVAADLFEGKRIAFIYTPDKYVVELLEK